MFCQHARFRPRLKDAASLITSLLIDQKHWRPHDHGSEWRQSESRDDLSWSISTLADAPYSVNIYSGLDCIEMMSGCEISRSPDQLNEFEKLSGRRPLHGDTLAGRSTALTTHVQRCFWTPFVTICIP